MPVFTDAEYTGARPSFHEAWRRLPILAKWEGVGIRWVGPLVDLGHDRYLGDLSESAYGHLESCGWLDVVGQMGPALDAAGRVRAPWRRALIRAARLLGSEGMRAGPEEDVGRWASWLMFELAEGHAWLRPLAERRGAAR